MKPEEIKPPTGENYERAPIAVEQKWIDTLERKGPESVRMLLSDINHAGSGQGSSLRFLEVIHDGQRHTGLRWFAESWLANKDAQSRERSETQHRLLKVTVVGTLIAAAASVLGLIATIVLHFLDKG